ncbi:MAG: hypothetical protein SV375_09010 [Thermodesulfobacteriota bacterium]|nr:hypothetical protein [Thermodesulfobacteriota bacterium]
MSSKYNRDQIEAIIMIHDYLKSVNYRESSGLKNKIQDYLSFRREVHQYHEHYFSEFCTNKCFASRYSACCNLEAVAIFFADVAINVLLSSDEEIYQLIQALRMESHAFKCVYLGNDGCLWRLKPIACEMFLCEKTKKAVFDKNETASKQWEDLKLREKAYTWPDKPVLFNELEEYFIKRGFSSDTMYFHKSPGLLRVKALANRKKG